MRECISIHIGQAGIQTGEHSKTELRRKKLFKNCTGEHQRSKITNDRPACRWIYLRALAPSEDGREYTRGQQLLWAGLL